jgi:hypothetical protein
MVHKTEESGFVAAEIRVRAYELTAQTLIMPTIRSATQRTGAEQP